MNLHRCLVSLRSKIPKLEISTSNLGEIGDRYETPYIVILTLLIASVKVITSDSIIGYMSVVKVEVSRESVIPGPTPHSSPFYCLASGNKGNTFGF